MMYELPAPARGIFSNKYRFILPQALSLPLRLVPDVVHTTVLATVLNRIFAAQLRKGELDFLSQRVLCIHIRDARIRLRLRMERRVLTAAQQNSDPDVVISGNLHDFMELALGHEDPDTLFFQRRLNITGDTELGLHVKNFLDALDMDELALPGPLRFVLKEARTED